MKNLYPIFKDYTFYFNKFTGLLIKKPFYKRKINKLSYKEKQMLEIIENPFLISNNNDAFFDKSNNSLLNFYVKLLIWLYRYCYPGLYLLSHLRLNIFSNSKEAINAFCKIHPQNQHNLCLPRSIFAITTSKRFKGYGVMFIGVFHPSRHMHAWIIEDGYNPCEFDKMWINFTPVALMS